MNTTHKTAKVIKEYTTTLHGRTVTVPVGATVSNQTAMGFNDAYRFWNSWKLESGNTILAHDLTHYGVNVPADHCEPWPVPGTVDATNETNHASFDQA